MKVLVVTSEWSSKNHPNHVPFLKDNILSLKSKDVKISIYKIKSESMSNRLSSIFKLRKKIRDDKYDVIHIHWGYNGLFCLGLNTPVVVTFHGSDLNRPFPFKIRSMIAYLFSKISTITSNYNIFVSEALVKNSLIKKKKMTVIPMGIDLEKFCPKDKRECRDQLELPLNKHIILFGGNSSQVVKRLPLAMSAFSYLDDKYKLITIDYIDHNLIPIYMNACDMLLMTSAIEGSPTMIKEALACNVPVVSTNVGDVKEQLNGLENCFIIKSETPREIASVVKKCIKNQVVPNGRAKMLNFSVNVLSNEIIKIYRSLLL